jgi:hypothetical protein
LKRQLENLPAKLAIPWSSARKMSSSSLVLTPMEASKFSSWILRVYMKREIHGEMLENRYRNG